MLHAVLSSPVPRDQQSAHTTLDTTNECFPPCSLDMPFARLLRFVNSALGVMGWSGTLDSIAFIELLPYLLPAICAAIVTITCIAAIFMGAQAPADITGLEAEAEAEELAEIEAVVPTLPTRTALPRSPVLTPLDLPETCETKDSSVPVLLCFRQSPRQRSPRVQRGFGAVHCVEQSVISASSPVPLGNNGHLDGCSARLQGRARRPQSMITASSWQQVHQLILTTRDLAAARRLQCRWRGLVARRSAQRELAVRRSAQAKRHRRQAAAFCKKHPEFAYCSTEVSALLADAVADPFFFDQKRILGAGAFGTVYQPRGWEAAVKVVSIRGAEIPEAAVDLAKEARLLQMASVDGGNPHVLRMHAAFPMGDHACIAVDLAPGGDLLCYMRRTHRGSMPQAEACLYTRQLAAAVEWLHLCNVAHRDIKLDNVLLREPGHVVLADLGLGIDLSTLEEWDGMCDECCGTQTTMAPEVVDGRDYDPKLADMWSLGVTALALLAPRTPDEHGCDQHGYYAWSSAAWGYDTYEDEAYGQYVALHDAAPGPTAIAELLQTSDEHDCGSEQLPAAVLVALDGMLRIDPYDRISAAQVVSCLRAEPTPDPCHSECYSECYSEE